MIVLIEMMESFDKAENCKWSNVKWEKGISRNGGRRGGIIGGSTAYDQKANVERLPRLQCSA